MRSRRAALAVVVTVLVGVVAVLIGHTRADQPFQQRLGVFVSGPVVFLRQGDVGCQGPIALDEDISVVQFNPGTVLPTGPAVTAIVRESEGGATLATGKLPAGFDPRRPQTVKLARAVPADTVVDVCFRDEGPGTVQLFGDTPRGDPRAVGPTAHPTLKTSAASINGVPLPDRDIAIVFPRAEPESALALVPRMFRRAALFRPGWVGPWTFWVLTALLLVGAPVLLWRALARALEHEDPR